MHYAIRGNAVNSLRTLLKLGVSVMDEDYKGRNPLFIAAEQGNYRCHVAVLNLTRPFWLCIVRLLYPYCGCYKEI